MKGFPATVLLEPILDNSTQGQTNKNMVCLEILSHVMLGLTVQGFPTISSPSTTSGQLYSRGKTKKNMVSHLAGHIFHHCSPDLRAADLSIGEVP